MEEDFQELARKIMVTFSGMEVMRQLEEAFRYILDELNSNSVSLVDEIERIEKEFKNSLSKRKYKVIKFLSKCNGLEKREVWRKRLYIHRARSMC